MKYIRSMHLLFLLLQTVPAFISASEAREQNLVADNQQPIILDNGINMGLAEFYLVSGKKATKDGTYIEFMGEKVNPALARFEDVEGTMVSQELSPARGYRYYINIMDNGNNSYTVVTRDRLALFIQGFNQIIPKLQDFERKYGNDNGRAERAREDFADIFTDLKDNLEVLSSPEAFLPQNTEEYEELKEKISTIFYPLAEYNPQLSRMVSNLMDKKGNILLKDNSFELDVEDGIRFTLDGQDPEKVKYTVKGGAKEYYLNFKKVKLPVKVDSYSYLLTDEEDGIARAPFVAIIKKKEENHYSLSINPIAKSLFKELIESESSMEKNIDFIKVYFSNLLSFLVKDCNFILVFSEIFDKEKEGDLNLYDMLKLINNAIDTRIQGLRGLLNKSEGSSSSEEAVMQYPQELSSNTDDSKLLEKYSDIKTKLCDIIFFLNNKYTK